MADDRAGTTQNPPTGGAGPHAFRAFVEAEMDRRGWKASDLARRSGVSKQVLSNLLNDDRPRLTALPVDKTIDGLADAFAVDRNVVLTAVGEAMGLPVVGSTVVYDAAGVSDEDLIRELACRLARSGATAPIDGSATGDQRMIDPNSLDLAAYVAPPEGTERERWDRCFGEAGEESQDPGDGSGRC